MHLLKKLVLENLGFCLFTSFALVNNDKAFESFAKLFKYKTGIDVTANQLITYAISCIENELNYECENVQENIYSTVPMFTKVLHRFFNEA
jgi:aldehyde:ferredoxin oxidoreductase